MKYIQLTKQDGTPFVVNIFEIRGVLESPGGARVNMSNGSSVLVKERPSSIFELMGDLYD